MKVDTYLLGHWPSEQQSLHIGAAVAPVIQPQGPSTRSSGCGRTPAGEQLAPRGRLAASDGCRWPSFASNAVDWRNGMPAEVQALEALPDTESKAELQALAEEFRMPV